MLNSVYFMKMVKYYYLHYSIMVIKMSEESGKLKTIKIKEDTFRELLKSKALMEFHYERRVTFDEVLKAYLEMLPRSEIRIRLPGENKDVGESVTSENEKDSQ